MNVKFTIIAFFSIIMLSLSANEREDLLKNFKKENIAAEKVFQDAETQIELTGAAGNLWNIAESQLLRALDYKLRHTTRAEERLHILSDFYKFSRKVQKVYETPRENMGSGAGMQIYHNIAQRMQQHTAVLMLDPESEKRWRQISDAEVNLGEKTIKLSNGVANFNSVMHNQKVNLEILLFPKDTFSYQNCIFAIIRTDIPFAGNDDFSRVYLCELKKSKLLVHSICDFPLITKWELQESCLLFFSQDKLQKIQLKNPMKKK